MINLEAYADWCAERYARTTAYQRVSDARTIIKQCSAGEVPPPHYYFPAAALQQWATEDGADLRSLEPAFSALLSTSTRAQAVKASTRRKLPAKSFSPHDWRRLAAAIIEAPEPEARIEELVLLTGLRIGDVLRIERKQLDRAIATGALEVTVKGGKVREIYLDEGSIVRGGFEKLAAQLIASRSRARVLHEWISPRSADARPYYAAYQRVRRHLLKLAEGLELDGRVHLHRIRRTIAVEAYRASQGDIVAVQQMLGHENLGTTQRYIDEERPAEVASLREKIHGGLFTKGKKGE